MLDTPVDIFLKLVRSAYLGMADYAREQDFFKTATREYVDGLLKRNSTIKVLTVTDPSARGRGLDLNRLKAYRKASNLTPQNVVKINDYLKTNIWLAKCLNSGAYISQPVRERVLGEMFKPR